MTKEEIVEEIAEGIYQYSSCIEEIVENTNDFLETKADILAVACPFCLQMFEEGLSTKSPDENKSVKDIAELLEESINKNNKD